MKTLNEREDALVALLSAAFPGHRVRGALGTEQECRRGGVPRPPEIHVAAGKWLPARTGFGQAGGFDVWTIRIIEAELRGPDRLRRDGLYPAVETLRETLNGIVLANGNSPLAASGGRLVQAGEPYAVWEETFEESIPAAGAVPLALFQTLYRVGVNAQNIAAGSATVPLPSFPVVPAAVGDLLLLRVTASGAIHSFGRILAINGTQATIEHAFSSLVYPGEAEYFRPDASSRFPVCEAPGSSRDWRANCIAGRTLEGALRRTELAPPARTIAMTFAPLRQADARVVEQQLLDAIDAPAAILSDELGTLWSAAVDTDPRIELLPGAVARVTVKLALATVSNFDLLEILP